MVYRFGFPERVRVMLAWHSYLKKSDSCWHHSLRKISSGAQVAPQHCPILRMSKSILSVSFVFILSMSNLCAVCVQFRRRYCPILTAQCVQRRRYIQFGDIKDNKKIIGNNPNAFDAGMQIYIPTQYRVPGFVPYD